MQTTGCRAPRERSGEVLEQVERCGVGPVQIVDDQHQRPWIRERGQRVEYRREQTVLTLAGLVRFGVRRARIQMQEVAQQLGPLRFELREPPRERHDRVGERAARNLSLIHI